MFTQLISSTKFFKFTFIVLFSMHATTVTIVTIVTIIKAVFAVMYCYRKNEIFL